MRRQKPRPRVTQGVARYRPLNQLRIYCMYVSVQIQYLKRVIRRDFFVRAFTCLADPNVIVLTFKRSRLESRQQQKKQAVSSTAKC